MFNDQSPVASATESPSAVSTRSAEQLEQLMVLSQAPLSLDEALAAEEAEGADAQLEPQR